MPLRENFYLDQMPAVRRPDLRGAHAEMLKRAALLLPRDRLMVELALKNRLTNRQLARVFALPPGTAWRRLQRLLNRLRDPMILALLQPSCPLPPEYRQLAIEFMLQGCTAAQLVEKHRLSIGQVRRMLDYVRGWQRGKCAAMVRATEPAQSDPVTS